MFYELHDIITYVLSCFLTTVQKDIYLQKKLEIQLQTDEAELDVYINTYNFKNELHSS